MFDVGKDVLLHLQLEDQESVVLEEIPFAKQGSVGHWLTSSVFNLMHARSREAEEAIVFAKSLQRQRDVSRGDVADAHRELRRVLGPDDQFWIRWMAFAEDAGIEL